MVKKISVLIAVFTMFVLFGFTACNVNSLDNYKAEKSAELSAYAEIKGKENYSADGWSAINKAVTDGKTAIEAADSKFAVDAAVTTAKAAIDMVMHEKSDMANIRFTLALGRMDYGVATEIKAIVNCISEWTALGEVTTLSELVDKYDDQYFTDKALIVYAFQTPTRGGSINEIEVSISDNEVLLEIRGELGLMDMTSYGIIVLEVDKADIANISVLRIVTNF